jgi:transposase
MSLKPAPILPIPEETVRVARRAFPKGSVAMRFRDEFGSLYHDEDFQALFPSHGQPGLAPWRLAIVTVLQFLENLSDRQAAEAVRARIDWKYALGLELTDPGFHFSVLTEFRARLVAGGAEQLLLDRMLETFQQRGLVKARGKQRTDSTHVLAAVHSLSLLELVGETLRATLNDLATVAPDWLREVAQPEWFERYVHRVEEYRLPKAKPTREAYAVQVGQDGFTLLEALAQEPARRDLTQRSSVEILQRVWTHHYERTATGCRWRSMKELPSVAERLCSPYDPEAHFSDKRSITWTGYKVHLTETCDEEAVHLIVHAETCHSMIPDVASTAGIHHKLAAKQLLPAEHIVDAGYNDAALLVSSAQQYGIDLIGPVRGNASWQAQANQGYDLTHFQIHWDEQRVICPQGKVSTKWRPGQDAFGNPIIALKFSRTDCKSCPVRSLCTRSEKAPRSVVLHPREQHEALSAARERITTAEGKAQYQVRAGVEGTLSQGVRAFGLRRTRYCGLVKTSLQQAVTAAAINVQRVVNWLEGIPQEKTRRSRFARLAMAS